MADKKQSPVQEETQTDDAFHYFELFTAARLVINEIAGLFGVDQPVEDADLISHLREIAGKVRKDQSTPTVSEIERKAGTNNAELIKQWIKDHPQG